MARIAAIQVTKVDLLGHSRSATGWIFITFQVNIICGVIIGRRERQRDREREEKGEREGTNNSDKIQILVLMR